MRFIPFISAALALTLTAPAMAQDADRLFIENGAFGVPWTTDADDAEAILLQNPAIKRADMRDIDDTDTTDYLYSYTWAMGGTTYDLSTFVERGNDRFVSVEISHKGLAACTALEQQFIARLGNGEAKTSNLTDDDGSPYTATTRVWMNGEVAGNIYGYVFLPAKGEDSDFCMVKILNAATI